SAPRSSSLSPRDGDVASPPTRTMAGQIDRRDAGGVEPQVVRYSERPELWDAIEGLSDEVWPEYNKHGDTLNHYWVQLYDVFPEWQFVLYDPDEKLVLAEG